MILASTSKGFVLGLVLSFSLFLLYISEQELRKLREINIRMREELALAKRLQRLRQFQSARSNVRSNTYTSVLPDNYCIWKPREDACVDILFHRIIHSKSPQNSSTASFDSKRWAFFGDSTMQIMVRQNSITQLNQIASDLCHCQKKTAPRCNMYHVFQLSKKEAH